MLFEFQNIQIFLERKTSSLKVILCQKTLSLSLLNELAQLLQWLSAHIEVQFLVITSKGDSFGQGFPMDTWDQNEFKSGAKILQKIILGLYHLPQLVIIDLKRGALGASLELSLGADLRIADSEAKFQFNHLSRGHISCCLGLLSNLTNSSLARNWIFSEKICQVSDFMSSGLLLESYPSGKSSLEKLFQSLVCQAPIQRIQAKASFLHSFPKDLQNTFEEDTKHFFAGLSTQDWQESSKSRNESRKANFLNPRNLQGPSCQ